MDLEQKQAAGLSWDLNISYLVVATVNGDVLLYKEVESGQWAQHVVYNDQVYEDGNN